MPSDDDINGVIRISLENARTHCEELGMNFPDECEKSYLKPILKRAVFKMDNGDRLNDDLMDDLAEDTGTSIGK